MVRKILIGFVLVGCFVSLFLSYSFLKEEAKKHRDPIDSVPLNAAVVIECQNIRSIWSKISETNLVWSELIAISEMKALDSQIRTVDSIFSLSEERSAIIDRKKTVVSFHSNGNEIAIFCSAVCSDAQFDTFEKMIKKENLKTSQKEVQKTNVKIFSTERTSYYYAYVAPFLLFSSSEGVIDKSISQLKNKVTLLQNDNFVKLKETSSHSAALHCFINFKEFNRVAAPYIQKSVADAWQNGDIFPNWATFDLSLKPDAFLFSGLSTIDSKNIVLKSAFNQLPRQSRIKPNLPKNIAVLKRNSLSNQEQFLVQNRSTYTEEVEEYCQCSPEEMIRTWLGEEILIVDHSSNSSETLKSILVETNGVENVLSRLTSLGVEDSIYTNDHGIDIYKVENKQFLNLFGEDYELEGEVFFCQKGDYVIFSSMKGIKKILLQWRKEKAVIQQTNYSSFSEKYMANFSSSDYYLNSNKFLLSLENVLKREYFLKVNAYSEVFKTVGGISWQSSPSGRNYQYHSLAINATQEGETNSNMLWSLKLKNKVIRDPELMKNHRTNTLEVFVQDNQNAIHLISATGKIKWSKQIESPIIGEVKQIDVYGNNKWQMLFNTATKIHLVDINGNEVKGFPVELKSPATNSIAVFDYENNKQYRMLIACSNKKIYNYNQEGEIVEGWNSQLTENLVVNPLKHFVSEGKDYILYTDLSGNIYQVDRRGQVRNTLTQKINTNLHELIKFEKGFTFTTSKLTYKDGDKICKIEFNDEKNCFVLDSNHVDYDLSIVDLDNDNLSEYIVNYLNRLEVYGPDKKLTFFETFEFNLGKKVKVIGDSRKFMLVENEGNIYVYTDKYTQLPNFPASGSVNSTIGDINKDGRLNIVTFSSPNELKVYSLEGLESL